MNKIEIDFNRIINFLKTASFMETKNTFRDVICKMLRYLINNETTWKEIATKANISYE